MKSLRGGGLLKLRTSRKSDASSFSWFILSPKTSAGTVVRTNFSSNRTDGRRYPRAADASLRAAAASAAEMDTRALFESARATAWGKSTDSIADAAGGKRTTNVRRESASAGKAAKGQLRAGQAIFVSFFHDGPKGRARRMPHVMSREPRQNILLNKCVKR